MLIITITISTAPLPAAHVTTPGVGVSMPAAAADGELQYCAWLNVYSMHV